MIDNSTPILYEILAFLLIGVPLGLAIWGISIVTEGIDRGLSSRPMRRKLLRWQKTFLRGRYVFGRAPEVTEQKASPFSNFVRGFIIFCLALWAIRIGARLLF